MSDLDRRGFLAGVTAFAVALPAGVKEVAEVQVTTLRPTDVVVFRCPQHLSADAHERIRESWRAVFPAGSAPKLVVIDGGASLEVVRTP
jgi:hypothetical protein